MKKLYLYILVFFAVCLKVNAQKSEAEYLQLEQKRIEQAENIELEIDKFIKRNINSYKLSDELLNQIKNGKNCSEHTSSKIPSEKEWEDRLLEVKKQELRKLYFKENKEKEVFFKATNSEQFITCVNGGFESTPATAGYTFATMSNSANWNGIDTVMSGNAITLPLPNNNYTTAASVITSTGNEPFLAAAGITVPRVRSGSRSIKLNATEINQSSSTANYDYDITTMRRDILINDNFMDVNFSLIMNNPGHSGPNFFRVTVYDSNNGVVDRIFIESNPNNCLFQSVTRNNSAGGAQTILYTGWVCARLNVGEILNQNATIEFMIADCDGGAHFSTVYIDDICGAVSNCENPQFGSINLNPLEESCPVLPLNVCGTYILPPGSSLGDISLDIIQGTTVVGTINTTSSLTTSTFCFQVNAADFPSLTGTYEFRVNANFIIDCPVTDFNWEVHDTSTNIGPDVDFTISETITNVQNNAGIVSWDDIADGYSLEIVSDNLCCNPVSNLDTIIYFSDTININSFNAEQISSLLRIKCFRWRVKPNTPCGAWSEWCCIQAFPNYQNPYEGICHPEPPCSGEYDLFIATNVNSGATSVENVDGRITAVNTITNTADASYFAGNQIILTRNSSPSTQSFWAQSGSKFLARIQPCVQSEIAPKDSGKEESKKTVEDDVTLVKIHDENDIKQNYIKIYPNPATHEVNISTESTTLTGVEILDATGKLIQTITNPGGFTIKLDVNDLNKGIYFLRIATQNNGIYIEKLIKN